MDVKKRKAILNAFIYSQFNYCPLIWMFHSRVLNNKINRIHKRALRITYNDRSLTFQELLEKDNSVTIHHRNIQVLATEIYKVLNGLSPSILNDIFVPALYPHNFRRQNTLQRRRVKSVRHGTESLSFLGPKIWDIIPQNIKQSKTVEYLNQKLKRGFP